MRASSIIAALLLGVAAPALVVPAHAADRPTIRAESDVPDVRFPVAKAPSTIIDAPELLALLPAARREAERLLRDYDVQDPFVLSQLRLGLAAVAVLDGRKADAERLIAEARAAETKPQRKAIGGLQLDLSAAMLGAPQAKRCAAGAARLSGLLGSADAAVVRDQFLGNFSEIQTASVAFFAGTAVGYYDPIVRKRGSLGVLDVLLLARWRLLAELGACRSELTAASRTWLDAPPNRPVDIWPEREPDAALFAKATPVIVAVWDRGYDVSMFPGQLARDPAEPLDGKDNDGNGVVDDTDGPTYDEQLRPRDGAIAPPTKFLQARLAAQMAYDKGERDLGFGLDTPEAALFAEFGRNAAADAQGDEFLAMEENRGRMHGTACASEIADGAPYLQLYNIAALPWGRGEDKLDIPYDEATIARWADAIARIGPRIRGAGVRVVNMSWGLTADEITQQLLDHGLETDQARARTRGAAMQKTIIDALHQLITASPNILFVIAAGNSDQPDEIQDSAIQRSGLPNLIVVGATGTNGRPTAFTVYGKSVAIYAQGEAVKLRWPGNIVAHQSGTSMAAPLVARAAGQMLAVRPELTATQLREGLLASATAGEGGLRWLHAGAAVRWASSR